MTPIFVEGDDPALMHQAMAAAMDTRRRGHPRDPGRGPARPGRTGVRAGR